MSRLNTEQLERVKKEATHRGEVPAEALGFPKTVVVRPSCCGRMAAIRIKGAPSGYREILYGNAIDFVAGEPMKPKRIRIQRGNPDLHGNVVQPGEYEFLWWADEEED